MANRPIVDQDTALLLYWLQSAAKQNGGLIPPFTNNEALLAIGKDDPKRFARAHGNVQSRIDFACFLCSLPPLGCAADAPFKKAWRSSDPAWDYPVMKMQAAAQTREWTDVDFEQIQSSLSNLAGQARLLWEEAQRTQHQQLRLWADGFRAITAQPRSLEPGSSSGFMRISWTRDELILALDLYLKHEGKLADPQHKEIIELSELLNRMGKIVGIGAGSVFRNPNGVAMKMMNFRRLDPQFREVGKSGLSRGNSLEGPVWTEYSGDPVRLAQVVSAIKATVDHQYGKLDLIGIDETDIEEAPEGKLLTRLHRFRERNKQLIDQRKRKALKDHGRLFCAACGFDFGRRYGDGSSHIIDCHHTKPVHTLADEERTNIKDLVLLCANCHRVVHSSKQWLTIEQLISKLTRI